MAPENVQTVVHFFKVLSDENRLRMVGLLAGEARSVEELASLLRLTSPTVSHHLAKLRELHLVEMRAEGTTHLYRLNPEALHAMSKAVFTPEHLASLAGGMPDDAWERKVLHDFLENGRLKEIPASRKKRQVILQWLAGQFAPDQRYSEREVNEIIQRHHPDPATLRRELVGYQMLQREDGVYWRVMDPPATERQWH